MPALQTLAATGIDVVGVVTPESHLAADATRNGRIGLLGTRATVESGAYQRAVNAVAPDATLTAVACPELAPIIQRGFPFDERVVDTVRGYCEPLREAAVDTVILGCTHYPLVRPMLQRILGREVALVSSGPAIAARVHETLALRGLLNDRDGEGAYRFECTGDVEEFRTLGTRFLQMPLTEVRHVEMTPARALA
jgi:glutamate racemase